MPVEEYVAQADGSWQAAGQRLEAHCSLAFRQEGIVEDIRARLVAAHGNHSQGSVAGMLLVESLREVPVGELGSE